MATKFDELKALVAATEAEATKFYTKGNKSAGTRLRKAMQDLKRLATDVRKEVSDTKAAAVTVDQAA